MLLRLVIFTLSHLATWYAFAHIAFGADFDRLPDRSSFATLAAYVFSVLQYPHDLIIRHLPVQLLQQFPPAAIAVIALNSLLWGIALALAWQLLLARRNVPPAVAPK